MTEFTLTIRADGTKAQAMLDTYEHAKRAGLEPEVSEAPGEAFSMSPEEEIEYARLGWKEFLLTLDDVHVEILRIIRRHPEGCDYKMIAEETWLPNSFSRRHPSSVSGYIGGYGLLRRIRKFGLRSEDVVVRFRRGRRAFYRPGPELLRCPLPEIAGETPAENG